MHTISTTKKVYNRRVNKKKLINELQGKCNPKKYTRQIQYPVIDSDYNKPNASYEQQKSFTRIFWNGGCYYPVGILSVQSQK